MVKPSTSTSASVSSTQVEVTPAEPKYTGVRKRKWGKWVSEIRLPNSRERIWLGSYDTPEKAARAFDAAMFCLRGENAKFNFPHDPPHIAGGNSLAPSEIQVVAQRFANEITHTNNINNTNIGSTSTSTPDSSPQITDQFQMDMDASNTGMGCNWSYFNDINDFGYYDYPHNIGYDYFPPPPIPSIFYDGNGHADHINIDENEVHYSDQHSFLWNF